MATIFVATAAADGSSSSTPSGALEPVLGQHHVDVDERDRVRPGGADALVDRTPEAAVRREGQHARRERMAGGDVDGVVL